jgi:hypothetical protein
MKIYSCLAAVVIMASFSWAADSPQNALAKYESLIDDMLVYVHATQAQSKSMSFDQYDNLLKRKLLKLFERCMTGDFLEESKQRVEDALKEERHLAGSDYWYVTFIPASIATDQHRKMLENEPDKKVYSFRGRRHGNEIDQKITVIKTEDGWRISNFEHPGEG